MTSKCGDTVILHGAPTGNELFTVLGVFEPEVADKLIIGKNDDGLILLLQPIEINVCLAGAPARNGVCGDPDCVCA